jgi:hypothetical protein
MESFLTNIRLSIIGDNEIKNLLTDSYQLKEMYRVLDEIISQNELDQVHLEMLNNILVILNSLTYHSPKILNDYNTANKLVLVAVKHQDDDKILNNTFKCLMNLASKSSKNTNINLDNEIGRSFTSLLSLELNQFDTAPKNKNSLYLQIFKLLPHLNPLTMKILLPSLLKILHIVLIKPQAALLSKYKNSEIFLNCFENEIIPTPPLISNFSNLLPPLLYSISHLLSHEKPFQTSSSSTFADPVTGLFPNEEDLRVDELIEPNLYFTLTSLLKTNNRDLKLASIAILVNYSLYSSLSNTAKVCNVKKILPVLVQLIDSFDNNESSLSSFKSEYKNSKNFNPFFILSKLCLDFEFVHDFLINCNIIKKILEFLKTVNKHKRIDDISIEKLDNLSDFFLILSSITAENENNRKLIVNDDLIQITEKILKNHLQILQNNILSNRGKKKLELLGISNHLALSSVYLLRSLSRSVALLRTSLYETYLVQTMLNLVKVDEDSMETSIKTLSNDTINVNAFINDEILLKSVILSVLSNFVLDFSPLRTFLLSENDLLSIVSKVLLNTKHSSLKRNCLWCFRHILFNEEPEKKDEYLKKIGLDKVFGFIVDNRNDELIQEEAFNVLRNLTCDSKKHVLQTLNYKPSLDLGFFEFLNNILSSCMKKETPNSGLLESIAYVIVHMAGIDEETRDLIASKRPILENLKEMIKSEKVKQDVKLGCIWVLINLTWIENTTVISDDLEAIDDSFYDEMSGLGDGSHFDEMMDVEGSSTTEAPADRDNPGNDGEALRRRRLRRRSIHAQHAKRRVEVLNDLGFVEVLNDLIQDNNNVDLKERVKTCLFNLNRFN